LNFGKGDILGSTIACAMSGVTATLGGRSLATTRSLSP